MRGPRTVSAAAFALAGVALLLSGCTPESEAAVERPEGSIRLVDTQPRAIGDLRVVVGNISGDTAALSVAGGDGGPETADVTVGDVVELKGRSFEVVDVVDDTEVSEGDGTGASGAAIWVLVD
jgi:hypothetical protein